MVAHDRAIRGRPLWLKVDWLKDEDLAGSPTLWNQARWQVSQLTSRQREVLGLVASGLSTKDVAKELGISPRTVEIHRADMMHALGARSTADAVRIAVWAALATVPTTDPD